jgi:hypothetical protein
MLAHAGAIHVPDFVAYACPPPTGYLAMSFRQLRDRWAIRGRSKPYQYT